MAGLPSLMIQWYARTHYMFYTYLFSFFTAMTALNIMYVAYSGAVSDLVNSSQRGMYVCFICVFCMRVRMCMYICAYMHHMKRSIVSPTTHK